MYNVITFTSTANNVAPFVLLRHTINWKVFRSCTLNTFSEKKIVETIDWGLAHRPPTPLFINIFTPCQSKASLKYTIISNRMSMKT